MFPSTFIFIGRSGCGKGTQAKLLEKKLIEKENSKVLTLETGAKFREFLAGNSYASILSKQIYERGELQPDFLAVYMWAEYLIKEMKGGEHLILDGVARRPRETLVLDTALRFFERKNPVVIHVDVSREWSKERLKARGRMDDIDEVEVEKRLNWYDTEVTLAIEWFRKTPDYKVLDIKGEQPIESVHKEIMEKLSGIGISL